jgi:predicted transcriptional regulator
MTICTHPRRPRRIFSWKDTLRRSLQELEDLGFIKTTGELRNGRPVYVTTDIDQDIVDAWFDREAKGKWS